MAAKTETIDADEYKKAIANLLSALVHHSGKARTARNTEDQVAHAQVCEALANAFHTLYAPGKK